MTLICFEIFKMSWNILEIFIQIELLHIVNWQEKDGKSSLNFFFLLKLQLIDTLISIVDWTE